MENSRHCLLNFQFLNGMGVTDLVYIILQTLLWLPLVGQPRAPRWLLHGTNAALGIRTTWLHTLIFSLPIGQFTLCISLSSPEKWHNYQPILSPLFLNFQLNELIQIEQWQACAKSLANIVMNPYTLCGLGQVTHPLCASVSTSLRRGEGYLTHKVMAAIRWADMVLSEFDSVWSPIHSTGFTSSWETWWPP